MSAVLASCVVPTAEALNGSQASQACKHHSGLGSSATPASQWERHARTLAAALSDGMWMATEICHLGRACRAADLLLAAWTASGSRC